MTVRPGSKHCGDKEPGAAVNKWEPISLEEDVDGVSHGNQNFQLRPEKSRLSL